MPVLLVIFVTLACVQVTGEALSLEQTKVPGHDSLEEAVLETTIQSLPSSSSEKGNSEKSPLVTPSAASLADSVIQTREGRSCRCGQESTSASGAFEGQRQILLAATYVT